MEKIELKKGDYAKFKNEHNPYHIYDGTFEVKMIDKIDEHYTFAFLKGVGMVDVRKLNKVSPP